jgi:hypothetical protein
VCCHLAYPLLVWTTHRWPCGSSGDVACDVAADADHWLTATWHKWDPLVRYVGPPWVRSTNEVLTRGINMLRWPNEVLTRVTPSLFSDSVCVCLGSPVYTQMCLCPQVAPKVILIKSQPLINQFNLFYLL